MPNAMQYLPEPAPIADKDGRVTRAWFMAFFQPVANLLISVGNVFGPSGGSTDSGIALFDGTTGLTLKQATGTGVVHATSGVYSASDVTLAEIVAATAASRLIGRRSGSAGDWEEVSLGSGLSMSAAAVLTATGSGGTVTTTGTPANGNLTQFSGASSITNGDLSGDVTTSGTLAATIPTTILASGTYTPTLTNVANLDASTAYVCQWLRVRSVVTVSGKVDVDPTLAATSTQLGITLPVASNFANPEECGGTAFAPGIAAQGAAILGDATNNRAQLQFISADLTNQAMYFSFTYQVI